MHPVIRDLTIGDYPAVFRLWSTTEGITLGTDDTEERIALYLARNPGLSFVAIVEGAIVGTVLCGHDGRRGILRHLAVARQFRRQGIARALVNTCLAALAAQGIQRCSLFVQDENTAGLQFWEQMGWYRLEDTYRTLQARTTTESAGRD